MWDNNDRREIGRVKAEEYEHVEQLILYGFIKPEHREDIEITDYGLEWNELTPEICFKEYASQEYYDPDEWEEIRYDNSILCETCDGCTQGIHIEEIEDPDGESWGETFEFKTIFGSNDYYDLTQPQIKAMIQSIEVDKIPNPEECWEWISEHAKAEDWNPLLSSAWKEDPQKGVAALIVTTVEDHPELKEGFDPKLLKDSKEKLK